MALWLAWLAVHSVAPSNFVDIIIWIDSQSDMPIRSIWRFFLKGLSLQYLLWQPPPLEKKIHMQLFLFIFNCFWILSKKKSTRIRFDMQTLNMQKSNFLCRIQCYRHECYRMKTKSSDMQTHALASTFGNVLRFCTKSLFYWKNVGERRWNLGVNFCQKKFQPTHIFSECCFLSQPNFSQFDHFGLFLASRR